MTEDKRADNALLGEEMGGDSPVNVLLPPADVGKAKKRVHGIGAARISSESIRRLLRQGLPEGGCVSADAVVYAGSLIEWVMAAVMGEAVRHINAEGMKTIMPRHLKAGFEDYHKRWLQENLSASVSDVILLADRLKQLQTNLAYELREAKKENGQ